MAKLKLFISSTCYDLGIVRAELRDFIINMGYDPVMSDFSDILFDPRLHTHESCVQEISNSDMMILIIGSRYGGKAIPKALSSVDIANLSEYSASTDLRKDGKISITELEAIKAIQIGIPIYTFIEKGVLNDHLVYEKNKTEKFINKICFPSFQQNQEIAKYVFEFINFMRLRPVNNSICGFEKIEEIKQFLKKQWSGYFQRLLFEQRNMKSESKHIDILAEQIADIKTALMTSISDDNLRETARGAITYRGMISFLAYFATTNIKSLVMEDHTWDQLVKLVGIIEVINPIQYDSASIMSRQMTIFKCTGNRYFASRGPSNVMKHYQDQWESFVQMNKKSREAVASAILDDTILRPPFMLRKLDEKSVADIIREFEDNKQERIKLDSSDSNE